MDKTSAKNAANPLLKTDGGKTKSNAIEVPSINLPKGGGAIKGIDEKFSVNAVNGTASFSIPLPVSPARGAAPALNLSYNSGGGNGIFGLGWNLGLPSIKRKTDKGLPQYMDGIDSDTFLFSEAEDLVPAFKKTGGGFEKDSITGDYIIDETPSPNGECTIRYYKPRIEGLFARIERWTEKSTGIIKWRVITKDNLTTLFGWTADAVIADPGNPNKIFEWLPQFVFDDKGNCSQYVYKAEDDKGFDKSLLHHRNRKDAGDRITYTNRYLEKVLYGNKTPYALFDSGFPPETDYLFQTVFDYGEYDSNTPYESIHDWNFRADAFSEYKAGFEIRTTRLCKRVLLFHVFEELALKPDKSDKKTLIKSLNVEYDTTAQQDFTFLQSITAYGYIKKTGGSYSVKKMPATEFSYQKHDWNSTVKHIAASDLVHAPVGLDEQQYQFTDLFNEGLSGILTEQASGWYYKHNLGNGHFEQAKLVSPKPAFTGLGGQLQLVDLDADGGKQIASFNIEPKGYFELNDDNAWQPYQYFAQLPNVNMGDANTRMIDLDGDGLADLLITEDDVFTWYASAGRKGYTAARKVPKPLDEEQGPYLVFADQQQTIFLADMSGDGLTDIVRIRNGEVCYWPNLGYGKFGTKVAMDNAPLFDAPDAFNPSYLRLADIDGSGTPDIIYLGKNKFSCWMNLSGNRFAAQPFEIPAFPEIHNQTKISITDLLGNGVACIVWSSPLEKDAAAPLKYIDLMNSKKPHIMVQYRNNMGKQVSMEYTASTKYYIEDKLAGKPWITKLHFPVHCVSKTITEDTVTGHRFASGYKYHHGYYDHPEREFRGFGMVEQFDIEQTEHWGHTGSTLIDKTLNQPTVCTKSWVHTGAFLRNQKILTQFEHEYWYNEMARQGYTVTATEHQLPEARIIDALGNTITNLTIDERREAARACKGTALRSEVFALDAPLTGATREQLQTQLTPYTAAAHNCVIEMLQPKGKNKHAVFVVKESESITYHYERSISLSFGEGRGEVDPRIAHNLNIKLDEYGNVLESAAIVYPRSAIIAALPANTALPTATKAAQADTKIIYTKQQFTNDAIGADAYRLRLPSEVQTYELKVVPRPMTLYSISDFINVLSTATDIPYQDTGTISGTTQKRLIEQVRTLYYKNDLSASLLLGTLESLALPFESYQLAFTPALVTDIFGTKVTDAVLEHDGKFTHSEGDANWWIRSGSTQFNGPDKFYTPVSYTDPYGAVTKVGYYGTYFLMIASTEDAVGNQSTVDAFNFRTLSPLRMRDANDNLSEVLLDELGLVKAMALLGKGAEADDLDGLTDYTDATETAKVNNFFNAGDSTALTGIGKDLLQHATVRFVYDFTHQPVVVASIAREEHYQKNNNAPVQISFEYTGGMGKVIMKKVQAEPGLAKQVTVNIDGSVTITNKDTTPHLRWIGNGRTVLNNKGNPVMQYEPYFSTTFKYEAQKELVETGVTPLLYYDSLGRLIKTAMPDGSFTKVAFDAWQQQTFDANDTVKDSQWYAQRIVLPTTDPNRIAAEKAAKHDNTPTVQHLDSLGRPVLSAEHNRDIVTGADAFYHTTVYLDIENNLRKVVDARGNTVMQYKYDMLGNMVYQKSMDAGQRWLLHNIMGNPLRTWDERDHEFQYKYDPLHRPIESWVFKGDGVPSLNNLFDKIIYGEAAPSAKAKNLRGQIIKHYDTGGLIETPEYDFKGQPVSTTRYLFKYYKKVADWATINPADLETEAFTFFTETDALGRISKQTAPDGSVITPFYNEAGVLEKEKVLHPGSTETFYIKKIDYNEKGQRTKIIYGNDVTTQYKYDKATFRLQSLVSFQTTIGSPDKVLQDLSYTYDPVGNITQIQDDAYDSAFFNNAIIGPVNTYTYDALYRLVQATGRENATRLVMNDKDKWNDAPFMQQQPITVKKYKQVYQYDAVGNILQMKHHTYGGSWKRKYQYEALSNRLTSTKLGQPSSTFTYLYPHHAQHGFITAMPHLADMGWNCKEELIRTATQLVNIGTPETTYYQYDGQGQRIRKITENQADPGMTATKKEERIYIAGYETYRTYQANTVNFERESLSLLEEGHRFVMAETVKKNTATAPPLSEIVGARLVRYQLHNHLGSASLELNENAKIISYEEYHPFGTTAYQANNASIKAAAKRYRYTGMERDEETGLEYHSARYYLPWLGRWLSADPIGIGDGVNVYGYVRNNPTHFYDSKGTQAFSKNRYHIAKAHKHKAEIKKPEETKVETQKTESNKLENAIPKGGVGAIIGAPPGPTMVVPDTYDNRKMKALAKKVIQREAGPVTDTEIIRKDPAHKAAETKFKETVPKPKVTTGTKLHADHIVELQHDPSGKSGTKVEDFQWQEASLNTSQGSKSMHLKKNLPQTKGADVLKKVKPTTLSGAIEKANSTKLTSALNSPISRGVMRGVGRGLVVYGLYQSSVEIGKGYDLDMQSTGSIGRNTVNAVAKEAGGWAGAALVGSEGAAIGAAVGSVVPILGTAVGGFIGGLVGGAIGYYGGKEIVTTVVD
jgi:RHS repeat-associated protein